MSEILSPIVKAYKEMVYTGSEREQLAESVRAWLDRWWNAAVLRPIASETLVRMATASGAFSDDTALPNYIMGEIAKFS